MKLQLGVGRPALRYDMTIMPCCQGQDYDRMFDAKAAAKELDSYRRNGPTGATRRLLAAIVGTLEVDAQTSLLDIGGGVGVLQHELAKAGAGSITAVDASRAYVELLETEARARGYGARQTLVLGDFVEVHARLPACCIVTLDKVICCYPYMERLVAASASKARQLYAIVVPRDTALIRLGHSIGNWFMRVVMRWRFQGYVHRVSEIDQVCEQHGLALCLSQPGWLWDVRLYVRR